MSKKIYQLMLMVLLYNQFLIASKVAPKPAAKAAPKESVRPTVLLEQNIQQTNSSWVSKMSGSRQQKYDVHESYKSSYKIQPMQEAPKVAEFIDLQSLHQLSQRNQSTHTINNGAISVSSLNVATKSSHEGTKSTVELTTESIDSQQTELTKRTLKVKTKPKANVSMFESFTQLFRSKPDVNRPDRTGVTPLQQAVAARDIKEVKRLVEAGADINVQDRSGDSLIHKLVRNIKYDEGHQSTDMVKFFVQKGAKLDQKNNQGQTALHTAIEETNLDMVKFLIKNNANLNIQDHQGYSPIMAAVHKNMPAYIGTVKNPLQQKLGQIIKELVTAKADLTLRDKEYKRTVIEDVDYQIKYHGLDPEVKNYIHDALHPKFKKVAPQKPSPYTSLSVKLS